MTQTAQQIAEELKTALLQVYSKEQIIAGLKKSMGPPWPDTYVNRDTRKVYTPHHEDERSVLESDAPVALLVKGSEGSGKALALDTPLPTPTGWTTMGDVQPGDQLLSDWGESCNVIDVSPVMYGHPCYKVVFSDGKSVIADAKHLWFTIDSKVRSSLENRGKKYTTGTHAHLPHCQPKYEPDLVTTEEMGQTLLNRRGFHNHAIPIAAPLLLPEVELPIDPYILGAWLGDGMSRFAGITIGRQDQEEMMSLFEKAGYILEQKNHSDVQFHIGPEPGLIRTSETGRFSRNPTSFRAGLESLNLIQNKHIPPIYLRASYDQRLALLQGLMDTDGTISSTGKCEYCTTSEKLASGFEELCLSLAIKVRGRLGDSTCNGKVFKDYRHRFSFTPYIPVFRLSRKAERISKAGRHVVRQFRRYVVGVEPCESAPVKCVVVDSPSRLFLAGKGMIPTHNSVLGIIKSLERIRRGCNGILISPDLPHLKRSLWLEFRRWIPWSQVVPKHRYMEPEAWQPYAPFRIVFRNGAFIEVGGIDEPGSWEGPNVNFCFMDEMRRKKTADALKVMMGRVRIPGPGGIPPQLFICTTPRKHWLYEYFGGVKVKCLGCYSTEPVPIQEGYPFQCVRCGSPNLDVIDHLYDFKLASRVITLHVRDNEQNLQEGFAKKRALVLTEAEARVLIDAEWEDIDESQSFLPNMLWWDDCIGSIPSLSKKDPIVIAMDAATGSISSESDCFGLLAVSRHPDSDKRDPIVATRYVMAWRAERGGKIDYLGTPNNPGPERALLRLCGWRYDDKEGKYINAGDGYNVKCVVYDPKQLHDLGMRFSRKRIAWMEQFGQISRRIEADTDLLRVIQQKRLVHDNNSLLREHVSNADRKLDDDGHRLRIVKREHSLPVDLCVCLSMAVSQYLYLRL
jgi:hypothetical protein